MITFFMDYLKYKKFEKRELKIENFGKSIFHSRFSVSPSDYNQCMSKDGISLSKKPDASQPAYLAGMVEKSLAQYQHNQVGNTCTLHCISAAIRILTGRIIPAEDLADEIDALPFFTRLPYRWWRDGPVSPSQQVAIIRKLAKELNLPLSVRLAHPKPDDLITLIRQPDTVVQVTIGWMKGNAPSITLGDGNISYADNTHINWHTMIAASHEPTHRDIIGQIKPWGFVNSWVNQGDYLFWISDADFIRSWSFYTPFGGCRSTVIITMNP
jgi:hypothetical protein